MDTSKILLLFCFLAETVSSEEELPIVEMDKFDSLKIKVALRDKYQRAYLGGELEIKIDKKTFKT